MVVDDSKQRKQQPGEMIQVLADIRRPKHGEFVTPIQVLVEQTLIRMHRRTKNPGELRFPTQVRVIKRELVKRLEEDSSRPIFPLCGDPKFHNSTSLIMYIWMLRLTRMAVLRCLLCGSEIFMAKELLLVLGLRCLISNRDKCTFKFTSDHIGLDQCFKGSFNLRNRGSMELQTGKLSVVKPPHQAFCVKLDVVEFDEHVIEVLDFKLFYLQAKLS
ncbi:hypothetical protein M8C21_011896, partial [Ambrosia artemisiifolia]